MPDPGDLRKYVIKMRKHLNTALFCSAVGLAPVCASADILELSQDQMRTLVSQKQVLSAETIITDAVSNFGGSVMDIRGFLSEGRMTYRLLMQRDDGAVIELLVNGVNGRRISHNSDMGQVVSEVASPGHRQPDQHQGKLDQVAQYAQLEGAEERGVSPLDGDVASDGGIPHLTKEGLLERAAAFRQVHDGEQIRADPEGLLSALLQEEQPEVGRGCGEENEVRPVPPLQVLP